MTTSTTVSSNALNFLSFMQHRVDPRTGLYTLSIDLPELKANALSGPNVPLQLRYSPLNTVDSGFGIGWNLSLSQFTPDNSIIALHTGETFKVTGTGDGNQPPIKEKKLDSFHFHIDGTDSYRVVHKTGLVEHLKTGGSSTQRVALPATIYGPSGHGISLTYVGFNGGQRLASVRDSNGELLRILRDDYSVKFLLPPFDDQPESRFVMNLTGGRATEIVMPTVEQASWRFKYEVIRGITCIKEVETPLGGHETLDYQDTGHPFPGDTGRLNLPRVTRHRVDPGSGQPIMETGYRYTAHNFLGAGASISWADDGLDNLYKVSHTYDYGSTTEQRVGGETVSTVERTYNRFHLLTEETTTQNQCVKRMLTTYYAEDKPFEQQPAQFQLPKTIETRWELANDPTKVRTETTLSEFDQHGNPTREVQANGIVTERKYYASAGEDGCPKDPEGFVRHVKETTVYPAAGTPGSAPILRTRQNYTAHAPLQGAPVSQWLAVSEEELIEVTAADSETLVQKTLREYFDTPDDALLHGRILRQSETLNGVTTIASFEHDAVISSLSGERVLHTVETLTGFDGSERVSSSESALAHGLALLVTDENGVQVTRGYDALRRVNVETVAPGTGFEAVRHHDTALTSQSGGKATQTITDVKGVKTRSTLDGLGREVLREHQDAGSSQWLPLYSADYDALGRLVRETEQDWQAGKPLLELSHTYAYDDWNQQSRVTGPDGVTQVTETSPFGDGGPLQRSWLESAETPPTLSNRSVSQYNLFGKADWVERHDEHDKVVGRQEFEFDGLGQCLRLDEVLDSMTRSTRYAYDLFGRLWQTTLSDDTQVERSFAAHSRDELPTDLQVTPGNTAQPSVCVGEQSFDGLARLTRLTVGPRVEHYEYEGGKSVAKKRTTPAGNAIDLEYELNLTDQPVRITTPEGSVSYGYDKDYAGITGATSPQGDREYEYDALGHLQVERWVDTDNTRRESRHTLSLLGRQLGLNDAGKVDTDYHYDAQGRVDRILQGDLQADFEFNPLGQSSRITTHNSHSKDTLVTEMSYDSLGREVLRSLALNGKPPRTLSQTWQDDDQLLSRHLEHEGRSLLKEDFVYDLRGRLEQHNCSGEALPTDRYGNAIVEQMFLFDALDNIQRCVTQFADGNSDVARFTYATDDPCQLQKLTHSWSEGGYPASQSFAYDADGNLLNDELGRSLSYDSQGRLLTLTETAGGPALASYRYDGHNHLVAVREGARAETLRFYQGYSLSYTVQEGVHTQYLTHADQPLGQQQLNDHQRTLLLLTDASPSVIGECLQGQLRMAAYSAYGELRDEQVLESLLAFNGEVREPLTGWYLLGRGYRAYNPGLMRFHSPDSASPFGEGGLNPYVYCLGNPIRFRDPTGHAALDSGYDPIYEDPIEEQKQSGGGFMKWIYGIGAAIALIVTAVFAAPALIPALGAAAGFTAAKAVTIVGVAITVGGVAVTGYGIIKNDEKMMMIGALITGIGSIVTGGGKSLHSRGLAKSGNPTAGTQTNHTGSIPSATPATNPPGPARFQVRKPPKVNYELSPKAPRKPSVSAKSNPGDLPDDYDSPVPSLAGSIKGTPPSPPRPSTSTNVPTQKKNVGFTGTATNSLDWTLENGHWVTNNNFVSMHIK